jgi:predicted membrane-bound dolichyl-phosphate-mannose-protein mannosyltransferase
MLAHIKTIGSNVLEAGVKLRKPVIHVRYKNQYFPTPEQFSIVCVKSCCSDRYWKVQSTRRIKYFQLTLNRNYFDIEENYWKYLTVNLSYYRLYVQHSVI